MTPSVTRSTPSISAIGGISGSSKSSFGTKGLPRYAATRDDVVPPQTICFPSLAKNSAIILFTSSRSRGGPNKIFIGARRRIRTTQTVVSSPGSPPYSRSHSSSSKVAKVFAVNPTSAKVSIKSMMSFRSQPKLSESPTPA